LESGQDAKIVEACLAGDARAYAGLVRLHGRRVYALCLAMTGNAADAEDLGQEAFMRGFTELGSLRDRDRFGPWIAAIAGNTCRNFIKKRASRERTVAMQPDRPREVPVDLTDVRAMLSKLPEQHRIPLMLYYFDGHSTEGVAASLGISVEAVHTRMSRARRELRKLLESVGGAR
jgi:RNA polymerase sigma-70 factor (ECF subfamily)